MPDAASFQTYFLGDHSILIDSVILVARAGKYETLLTVWPIRLAMVCLVGTLALRLCHAWWPTDANPESNTKKNSGTSTIRECAKSLWLIGSFFSLFHAIAAMGFFHDWLPINAYEDTARQTKELLGVAIGFGLYFNYAFVLIWMLDAFWWTASEKYYERRPRWLHRLIYGFIIFIAINGVIVFESGWIRWTGVGCLVALFALYWLGRSKKTVA